MTKGEVRQVSLCSLRLQKDSVLYDIGSGTGSIAVEAAHLSKGIKVYAIEKKEEAVALLAQNKEKFQVANMEIIRGTAPEACNGLEEPTHVFIGGKRWTPDGNFRSTGSKKERNKSCNECYKS